MNIRPYLAAAVIPLSGLLAPSAQGALVLSNWAITSDTLSFEISGTFEASAAPATNLGRIWIAAEGNGSWINNHTNPTYVLTGTIDGVDVGEASFAFSNLGNGFTNVGLYLGFDGGPEPGPGIEFDFTDSLNNEISFYVHLTSAGKWNPENIDPASLELYWGGDPYATDTSSAISAGLTVIPEPGTSLLMGLGALLPLLRRRRFQAADASPLRRGPN